MFNKISQRLRATPPTKIFKFILIFIIANFIVTIFCIKKKIDLSREQILLNLFIKCESPKLDVIAEFVSLKL